MPEGMSTEVSPQPAGRDAEQPDRQKRWETLVEVVEVLVLAIVAVATAWSGYMAARWDGQQSLRYGHANADRFKADAASTRGGQELSADASMFTAYLQARSAGDSKLANIYVRRFTPDYGAAFAAWLKTSPFTNPAAPPGPPSTRAPPPATTPSATCATPCCSRRCCSSSRSRSGSRCARCASPRPWSPWAWPRTPRSPC